ncbi:MAG: hypothetical protein ACK56I_20235, partial [bacterium]
VKRIRTRSLVARSNRSTWRRVSSASGRSATVRQPPASATSTTNGTDRYSSNVRWSVLTAAARGRLSMSQAGPSSPGRQACESLPTTRLTPSITLPDSQPGAADELVEVLLRARSRGSALRTPGT